MKSDQKEKRADGVGRSQGVGKMMRFDDRKVEGPRDEEPKTTKVSKMSQQRSSREAEKKAVMMVETDEKVGDTVC